MNTSTVIENEVLLGTSIDAACRALGSSTKRFESAETSYAKAKESWTRLFLAAGIQVNWLMHPKGDERSESITYLTIEPDPEKDGETITETVETTRAEFYRNARDLVIMSYFPASEAEILLLKGKEAKESAAYSKLIDKRKAGISARMGNWRRDLGAAYQAAEKKEAAEERAAAGPAEDGLTHPDDTTGLVNSLSRSILSIDKKCREADWSEGGNQHGKPEFDATKIVALCADMLEVLHVRNTNLSE